MGISQALISFIYFSVDVVVVLFANYVINDPNI